MTHYLGADASRMLYSLVAITAWRLHAALHEVTPPAPAGAPLVLAGTPAAEHDVGLAVLQHLVRAGTWAGCDLREAGLHLRFPRVLEAAAAQRRWALVAALLPLLWLAETDRKIPPAADDADGAGSMLIPLFGGMRQHRRQPAAPRGKFAAAGGIRAVCAVLRAVGCHSLRSVGASSPPLAEPQVDVEPVVMICMRIIDSVLARDLRKRRPGASIAAVLHRDGVVQALADAAATLPRNLRVVYAVARIIQRMVEQLPVAGASTGAVSSLIASSSAGCWLPEAILLTLDACACSSCQSSLGSSTLAAAGPPAAAPAPRLLSSGLSDVPELAGLAQLAALESPPPQAGSAAALAAADAQAVSVRVSAAAGRAALSLWRALRLLESAPSLHGDIIASGGVHAVLAVLRSTLSPQPLPPFTALEQAAALHSESAEGTAAAAAAARTAAVDMLRALCVGAADDADGEPRRSKSRAQPQPQPQPRSTALGLAAERSLQLPLPLPLHIRTGAFAWHRRRHAVLAYRVARQAGPDPGPGPGPGASAGGSSSASANGSR